ncbi:hypothetical protein PFISCL1PPCAC_2315, partial [Pristionchus fissidentatus]
WMSLPSDGRYPLPSDGLSPQQQQLQQPPQMQPTQQQFQQGMQAMMQQQQYMMAPPSALPSTVFHPPPHSSLPSTSSPITPITPALQSPTFTAPAGPSTSSAAPLKRRRFSGAKIQPTRIKKVMQADEEIGRMVASVPVAIGRAMEHFAEKFLLSASSAVTGSGARTLAPHHLKMAMLSNPHFAFLEPILREVGMPVRAGDAYQFPQQATVQSVQHMQQQQALQAAAPPIQQLQQGGLALPPYMDVPSMIPSGVPTMMGATDMQQFSMHNPYLMQQMSGSYDPLAAMGQMGQMIAVGGSVPYQGGTLTSPLTASPITSPTGTPSSTPPGGRTARRSSSAVSNGGEGEVVVKKPRGRPRKNKKDKCVEDDLEVDASMANNGLLRPPSPGDIKKESNEADRLLMPPPPFLPMKPPPS